VINARNFDRLVRLMGSGKAVVGGQSDAAERYIAPTVLVASIDPGVRYPPYSKHTFERKIEGKLMP
jgi:hypothetical protein